MAVMEDKANSKVYATGSDDGRVESEAPDTIIPLTDIDKSDMYRLGRKQTLNRNFRMISIIGFSVVIMNSWEAQFVVSFFSILNGGFAGAIWTYVCVFIGFLFLYASMAEMASMAPTSGGQYHWVSEFAPKSCQKFLSYLTGWVSVMGWQTGITSVGFLAATQIQGLLVLNYPEYELQRWHGTLLLIAVVLFSIFFNTVAAKYLPMVEGLILIVHVFGFFALMIPLWALAPRNDASLVFTEFNNGGEWPTQGISCMVGMLSAVFGLFGADSANHMAEEIKNSSVILPKSMIYSYLLNGTLGFIMLITYCFCFGPLDTEDSALNSPTGFPFIAVFANATGSKGAASAMTAVLIILGVCSCISNIATASRQMFAFARDKGLPGSAFLAHVKPGWNIPLNAVMVSLAITVLLSLINIGSTVALNALVSLGVAALISAYIISLSCLIIKRLRKEPFPHARWSLGKWGLPINIVALGVSCIIWVFSFFPATSTVTPETMNWSIVIYAAAVIFSIVYYILVGRKHYVGPVSIVREVS